MGVTAHRETLLLHDTLANSQLAFDKIDTCIATIEHDGVVAFGEGTPSLAPGGLLEDVLAAVASDGAALIGDDLDRPARILDRLDRWDGPAGARMALDGAVHDWTGKAAGRPTWAVMGTPQRLARPTGYTVGIADVDDTIRMVQRAPAVGALKVKVGRADDLERLEAIRRVSALPVRIDPNEAWDLATALALTPRLRELGIHLLEQPFPAAAVDDYHRYREQPDRLPVFVDESCTDEASVVAASAYADGVVVKLSKSGGIPPTRRVMQAARRVGLGVMLSCMCESELAISQAALLAPLADRIDLDGHFLLRDPPYRGLGLADTRLVLGGGPGLGVSRAART
jgi:L-alanine-DL-glutamate epimerase-like enolase superfamily enzyme